MKEDFHVNIIVKISPTPSLLKRGIIPPFGPLRQRLRGEQREVRRDFERFILNH